MVSRRVQIKNPTGLHLRPAGIFCQEAMKYQSRVTFLLWRQRNSKCEKCIECIGSLRKIRR